MVFLQTQYNGVGKSVQNAEFTDSLPCGDSVSLDWDLHFSSTGGIRYSG
jgi:hypothetical protein